MLSDEEIDRSEFAADAIDDGVNENEFLTRFKENLRHLPEMLKNEEIASLMLSNGFTIKPGMSDLKDYVYTAARAIESAATAPLLARIAELELEVKALTQDREVLALEGNKLTRELDVMAQNTEAQAHASLQREIELTEKVEKLTRELEEARKDAMHAAALICDALPAPPSCNVLERNLWDVATVAAADAIRAAIKEQT